jgi:ketosteroid isomerase-like protein
MAVRDNLFEDIDTKDADRWAVHLADDAVMRFGNGEPVRGREACRDALAAFWDTIEGVRHDPVRQWETDTATIVEAMITYTLPGGRQVTVPGVTIYRTDDDGLIDDYRVFIDLAPLSA